MPKLICKAIYPFLLADFQSTEKIRYYLNGFHVKQHAQGGAVLAATSDNVLGVFHAKDAIVERTGDIWNLPKECYKACAPRAKDELERWLVILPMDGDNRSWHDVFVVSANNAEAAENVARTVHPAAHELILYRGSAQPIDGSFPDYARVVPTDVFEHCPTPAFNLRLFDRIVKVAQYGMDNKKTAAAPMRVYASPDSNSLSASVVFTTRSDFFAIIMPYSMDEHDSLPEWWETHAKPKPQ